MHTVDMDAILGLDYDSSGHEAEDGARETKVNGRFGCRSLSRGCRLVVVVNLSFFSFFVISLFHSLGQFFSLLSLPYLSPLACSTASGWGGRAKDMHPSE